MSYKLIASDMDGTLLTKDKRISPAVESAVCRASRAGVVFCLASGRPLCGMKKYMDSLGLSSPAIACNGTVIIRPDGEVLYRQCLEPAPAREVLAFGKRFGVTMCVWSDEKLFVSHINERTEHYSSLMSTDKMTLIEDWEPVIAMGIDKILWHSEVDVVARYQQILADELTTPVNYFTSNPRFLEFVDHMASKAEALRRLADILAIDIADTIAVGDGFNDLEMLRAAGIGVAMGNAPDEIKRQCGWVAPTNENDGVAALIEHFILAEDN